MNATTPVSTSAASYINFEYDSESDNEFQEQEKLCKAGLCSHRLEIGEVHNLKAKELPNDDASSSPSPHSSISPPSFSLSEYPSETSLPVVASEPEPQGAGHDAPSDLHHAKDEAH